MNEMEYSRRVLTTLLFLVHCLSTGTITPAQGSSLMKFQSQFAGPLMLWAHHCMNSTTTGTDSGYDESSLYLSSWLTLSSSDQIVNGFYNASYGSVENPLFNVIGLCRGDMPSSNSWSMCLTCLANAAKDLPSQCRTTSTEAIGYYEGCTLRYSDTPIIHKMETSPSSCLIVSDNASDVEMLNRTRAQLLHTLKAKALANKVVPYFAMGEMNISNGGDTMYAMLQCTPDISEKACSDCVDAAVRSLVNCSPGNEAARIYMPSCSVRYQSGTEANFFYSSQPSQLPKSATTPKIIDRKNETSKYIMAALLSTVSLVAFLALLLCFVRERRSRSRIPTQKGKEGMGISIVESLQFEFHAIKAATDDFSPHNRIGQGGFGTVYKGKLCDGQEIAVKRLARDHSGQGKEQFKNEIVLLARLQHRNLVKLLGFCLTKEERLLIYEFVPNASLDHFLFDHERSHEHINWEKRTKIIGGIARGLLYLHEDSRLRIIHRDLKASNILLDAEMNPKIADFGLAKLFVDEQSHEDTSRIVGTYGYMAPEYVVHGFFSLKADVYSFGILLLEIICGRQNRDVGENTISLTSLVWRSWKEGTILSMVDPTLMERDSSTCSEMIRYIHIGLLCVQENESERPTMSAVVLMFSTDYLSLAGPSSPGFIPDCNDTNRSCCRTTGASSNNKDDSTDLLPR